MKINYKLDRPLMVFENMAVANQIEYSGVGSYNTTHYLSEHDIICTINYKHTDK